MSTKDKVWRKIAWREQKFFSFLASAQEVSFRPSTSPTPCDNKGNSGNLLQHPDSLLCDSRSLRCCSHIICDQGFHHSVPFGGDCWDPKRDSNPSKQHTAVARIWIHASLTQQLCYFPPTLNHPLSPDLSFIGYVWFLRCNKINILLIHEEMKYMRHGSHSANECWVDEWTKLVSAPSPPTGLPARASITQG